MQTDKNQNQQGQDPKKTLDDNSDSQQNKSMPEQGENQKDTFNNEENK